LNRKIEQPFCAQNLAAAVTRPKGERLDSTAPAAVQCGMGFNRRRMESERKAVAEKEAAARRALKPQILEDAERLLDGTGWLPEPLRTQETESADATDGNTAEDTEAPPAFLADDEKSTSDEESDEPAVIAAE
jgi:hypothetical protein